MKVENSGDPNSPIWIIAEEPYQADEDKCLIWSGGHGYTFKKIWSLSGIGIDPYIYVLRPVLGATYDNSVQFSKLINALCGNTIPFVLPTSVNIVEQFCPNIVSKSERKAILK